MTPRHMHTEPNDSDRGPIPPPPPNPVHGLEGMISYFQKMGMKTKEAVELAQSLLRTHMMSFITERAPGVVAEGVPKVLKTAKTLEKFYPPPAPQHKNLGMLDELLPKDLSGVSDDDIATYLTTPENPTLAPRQK